MTTLVEWFIQRLPSYNGTRYNSNGCWQVLLKEFRACEFKCISNLLWWEVLVDRPQLNNQITSKHFCTTYCSSLHCYWIREGFTSIVEINAVDGLGDFVFQFKLFFLDSSLVAKVIIANTVSNNDRHDAHGNNSYLCQVRPFRFSSSDCGKSCRACPCRLASITGSTQHQVLLDGF